MYKSRISSFQRSLSRLNFYLINIQTSTTINSTERLHHQIPIFRVVIKQPIGTNPPIYTSKSLVMLCFRFLLLSSVVVIASAFTLPAGLNDGVYEAFIDERGHEVHRRLPAPSLGIANTNTTVLEERQTDAGGGGDQLPASFRCGCG